jgi:hypothetical protein
MMTIIMKMRKMIVECVRNKTNVDTTNLHKAYRTKFPQWQRLGKKLKSCWDNHKDGQAFKTFQPH